MRARKRPKAPHAGHDHGYKLLFSHPQTVAELIHGFLPPDWVDRLDLSTLERVGNDFVSGDLQERRSDVIWRMRWNGGSGMWLYFLLEFQSTIDPFMAVRLLTYAGLLLEEILRKEKLKPGAEIPVVLPVVLYNGITVWLASVLRRIFPGVITPEVADLEGDTMTVLEANMRRWYRENQTEGMRELLLQLLERRFGPLPEEKRSRVEAIKSHVRLKRLADKILTAKSLQEMGI